MSDQPTTSDTPDGKPWWRRWWGITAIALGILIVIGAASGEPDTDGEPAAAESPSVEAVETADPVEEVADEPEPTETGPAQHRESRLACSHFRNVMGDASDGVLTDEELREKLREVDENAAIATAEVQAAARSMFATVTSGTVEEFTAAVEDMHEACLDAGW